MRTEALCRKSRNLRKVAFFESIEEKDLLWLESRVRWIEVAKGGFLPLSKDGSSSLAILKKGRIKLSRLSGNGKELGLEIIGAGDVFGEAGLVDTESRGQYVEALEDSLIAIIPRGVLQPYFERRPELLLRLSRLMAVRYRRLEDRLVEVAFQSVATRLAHLLLQLSQDYGILDSRGILVPMKLSQATLGSLIGVSREAVNIALSRLREKGLIAVNERRLIIRRQDALEQFGTQLQ